MIKMKQITFSTCEDSEGLYGLGEDGSLYLWDYDKIPVKTEDVEVQSQTQKVVKGPNGQWWIYKYGWKLQVDQLNK